MAYFKNKKDKHIDIKIKCLSIRPINFLIYLVQLCKPLMTMK